jgi:hypothetical protein
MRTNSKASYRSHWVVRTPDRRILQLFDGTYDVALRFSRERWGPGTEIVPWLIASDALRAKALQAAPLSCATKAPGTHPVSSQERKMTFVGGRS